MTKDNKNEKLKKVTSFKKQPKALKKGSLKKTSGGDSSLNIGPIEEPGSFGGQQPNHW
ncbi:MAG: hypothetical protein P4L16_07245 [Chlamydiales bacterium]|nr:hypothetical protein [Chlamydiales bacterium]